MKLGEFYDKTPPSAARKKVVYDLNNAHKEAVLEDKIADLQQKVSNIDDINAKKSQIQNSLDTSREENSRLIQENNELEQRIDKLDAEVQEKHRVFEDLAILTGRFDSLSEHYGTMNQDYMFLRERFGLQEEELDQLRVNNTNLQLNVSTYTQEAVNRDTVINELRKALDKLTEEHQSLTSFSTELSGKYTEASDMWDKLSVENSEYKETQRLLQKQKEELTNQLLVKNQQGTTEGEARLMRNMNHQMDGLLGDIETISKENAHLRNELSTPQRTSVGAIARQEGFKIPLASAAVNYRKNTLGSGKPTLLRFANKELGDDN